MTGTTPHYNTTFKPTHYPSKEALHSTFGGVIIESDYCTEYSSQMIKRSIVADRIATARKFDYQCLRNSEIRERGKKS